MTCITFLTLAIFLSAVNPNTITLRNKLPLGYRTVEQCNENDAIYVDKTQFAQKLLESGTNSFLFLRPRRFGKTFFLNTLESILRGKQDVFKDYFIGNPQNGYDWRIHRVLRLTFQEHDPINTLVQRLIECANHAGVAEKLAHIKKTSVLYFEELLRELSHIDIYKDLKPGIPRLALLIDEYDLPFKNSNTEIRAYFHRIFGLLKKLTDEGYIRFVFFTGCNKVNLFADYRQNTTHSGISTTLGIEDISLSPEYSTICGFAEEEIKTYFDDHVQEAAKIHNVTSDVIYNEMKVWYDGYRFTRDDAKLLYNPVSLIHYLYDKDLRKPKNYWVDTQKHPRTVMEELIAARVKDKNIVLDLKTHYTGNSLFQPSEDILHPKQGEKDPKQDKKDRAVNLNQHSLESILFQNGYLTIRKHDPEHDLYSLRFPNLEIMEAFMKGVEIGVVEDDESITLHKKAILLKLDPLSRSPTPEWDVQREVWTTKSSGKGGEIDFLIETSNYRIIIECKFEATPREWEKAREQAANYRFPDLASQGNRPKVRLVFNFNGNGIVQWMGTEHDVHDKFVRMLVEDPMEKSNNISENLNKYICDQCNESFPFKYELENHTKRTHGEKRFQCNAPNCNEIYDNAISLSNHKRVHQNHPSSVKT